MNEAEVTLTLVADPRDFQILDIFMSRARIRPSVIRSLAIPQQIDFNKGIVISGRAPIWLYAHLLRLCQNAPWVATFSPMDGAIVVASNSANGPQVGEVIRTETILPYLPKHPEEPKQEGPKPGINSKAIAFLGPPRSGKSVLMNAVRIRLGNVLSPEIFQRQFYVLRACPDGEGDWFSEIPKEQALTLRYKNRFDDTFVSQICQALEQLLMQKQLLLVDCGGKIDKKNERILNLCTHAIIVSRDPEQIPVWRGAAELCELEILAEIESVSKQCAEVISDSPILRMRLGELKRGNERNIKLPEELLNVLQFNA